MSAGVIAYRLQRNLVEFYSSPFRRFVRLLFHTTPFPISPATLLFHTSSIVVLCQRFATPFWPLTANFIPLFFFKARDMVSYSTAKVCENATATQTFGGGRISTGIYLARFLPSPFVVHSFLLRFLLVTHLPA